MKRNLIKKITILLSVVMVISAISTVAMAKNGDIVGYVKYTDIACYINHYPIASYNINDRTAVVAEDLRNYGFNVEWNGNTRTLNVSRNNDAKSITPYGTIYKNATKMGQNAFAYLQTDIKTYVNGQELTSYNIGGNTVVFLEDLSMFGEVVWVPEIRALKMWIDGLPCAAYKALEEEPSNVQSVVNSDNTTAIASETRGTISLGAPFDALEEFWLFNNVNLGPYYKVGNFRLVFDSADNIGLRWAAKNNSTKTIKYITYNLDLYNAVDDSISNVSKKITGPIGAGKSFMYEENIGNNADAYYAKMNSLKIEYTDGSVEEGKYEYTTWHDIKSTAKSINNTFAVSK